MTNQMIADQVIAVSMLVAYGLLLAWALGIGRGR